MASPTDPPSAVDQTSRCSFRTSKVPTARTDAALLPARSSSTDWPSDASAVCSVVTRTQPSASIRTGKPKIARNRSSHRAAYLSIVLATIRPHQSLMLSPDRPGHLLQRLHFFDQDRFSQRSPARPTVLCVVFPPELRVLDTSAAYAVNS